MIYPDFKFSHDQNFQYQKNQRQSQESSHLMQTIKTAHDEAQISSINDFKDRMTINNDKILIKRKSMLNNVNKPNNKSANRRILTPKTNLVGQCKSNQKYVSSFHKSGISDRTKKIGQYYPRSTNLYQSTSMRHRMSAKNNIKIYQNCLDMKNSTRGHTNGLFQKRVVDCNKNISGINNRNTSRYDNFLNSNHKTSNCSDVDYKSAVNSDRYHDRYHDQNSLVSSNMNIKKPKFVDINRNSYGIHNGVSQFSKYPDSNLLPVKAPIKMNNEYSDFNISAHHDYDIPTRNESRNHLSSLTGNNLSTSIVTMAIDDNYPHYSDNDEKWKNLTNQSTSLNSIHKDYKYGISNRITDESMSGIRPIRYNTAKENNQYRQTNWKEHGQVRETRVLIENSTEAPINMESTNQSQLVLGNHDIESEHENNQEITIKSKITTCEKNYESNELIKREYENKPIKHNENTKTKINRYQSIYVRTTSKLEEKLIERSTNMESSSQSQLMLKNDYSESELENNQEITTKAIITNCENQHEINASIIRVNDNKPLCHNNTEIESNQFSQTNWKEHDQAMETQILDGNLIEKPISLCYSDQSQQMLKNDDSESDCSSSYCSSVGEKMGLDNPSSFCFLNSVVQVLRGCVHFHNAIVKYYQSKKIENIKDTTELNEQNKIFVVYFCKLLSNLKNGKLDHESLEYLQNHFACSFNGDDVNKCFMILISIVNNVIKEPRSRISLGNDPVSQFKNYKNANHGFVFDCFYGQMCHTIFCEKCGLDINIDHQLFTSLSVPVQQSAQPISLESCLNKFLKTCAVETDLAMDCNCASGTVDISLRCELIHSPRYLFIYLNRGSCNSGKGKNDTFVTTDGNIHVPTFKGKKHYRLISVIDHIGTNECGHFYCKCNYETKNWWMANDSSISDLGCCSIDQVISENTIVFLFKRTKTINQ